MPSRLRPALSRDFFSGKGSAWQINLKSGQDVMDSWLRHAGLLLLVLVLGSSAHGVEALTVLTFNLGGNGVADWSTNSPQVRAIGRQVSHLDPDLLTLQEVPFTNTWRMTQFVAAFRPGFFLATNSGTDGYIRSVILSRFPIVRSQKWLDGVALTNFGFEGSFTRDLFEAQINVPGFDQPLHVFTTHLKSGQDTTSSARRGAEARAISNFLVTVFLPTNGHRPYLLTGDMNEDLARPPSSHPRTIEQLTSAPTGLRLVTPTNPVSGGEQTYSTRTNLTKRYDYILPGGLLFLNHLGGQIFCSDKLSNAPPPVLAGDSATASDHAPVLLVFGNPYPSPLRLLSLTLTNQSAQLRWESAPGRRYQIDVSSNLVSWTPLASDVIGAGLTTTFSTNAGGAARFFRVLRAP